MIYIVKNAKEKQPSRNILSVISGGGSFVSFCFAMKKKSCEGGLVKVRYPRGRPKYVLKFWYPVSI